MPSRARNRQPQTAAVPERAPPRPQTAAAPLRTGAAPPGAGGALAAAQRRGALSAWRGHSRQA